LVVGTPSFSGRQERLAAEPPVSFNRKPILHHRTRQVIFTDKAANYFSSISVQIDLPTLHSLPSRQRTQMVARGIMIARRALSPWATRSGHFWRVYGVEPIRSPLASAADCIAVVMVGGWAGKGIGDRCDILSQQPVTLRTSDNAQPERAKHSETADQRLLMALH
jgi:hypothetical protein